MIARRFKSPAARPRRPDLELKKLRAWLNAQSNQRRTLGESAERLLGKFVGLRRNHGFKGLTAAVFSKLYAPGFYDTSPWVALVACLAMGTGIGLINAGVCTSRALVTRAT